MEGAVLSSNFVIITIQAVWYTCRYGPLPQHEPYERKSLAIVGSKTGRALFSAG